MIGKMMAKPYREPDDRIKNELINTVKRVFPEYFNESNVHPQPLNISFEQDKSEWNAVVRLNWQRKPDFKFGTHTAIYRYKSRNPPSNLEKYWYCERGLPGD